MSDDDRGEYVVLAERAGMTVVQLGPGCGQKLNPLGPTINSPGDATEEDPVEPTAS